MIVEAMHALVNTDLSSYLHCHDTLGLLNSHWHFDWLILAQEVPKSDILGDLTNAWNNFIRTGQVWALLIGLVLGYVFRGMTS